MVDCRQCIRCKAKPQDIEQLAGMVECKVSGDAGEVLAAFSEFSSHQMVRAPFLVKAVPGRRDCGWPLQFAPESVESCEGFVKA